MLGGVNPVDRALMPYQVAMPPVVCASFVCFATGAIDVPVSVDSTKLHPPSFFAVPASGARNSSGGVLPCGGRVFLVVQRELR